MLVKISGSKRVPHSKRSYSRHIFCNQLMFYVSDTTLSNDKYRKKTLTASLCVTLFISEIHRSVHSSFVSQWIPKNEPFTITIISRDYSFSAMQILLFSPSLSAALISFNFTLRVVMTMKVLQFATVCKIFQNT